MLNSGPVRLTRRRLLSLAGPLLAGPTCAEEISRYPVLIFRHRMPDVTSEWLLFVMPSQNMEPTIKHNDLLMTIPPRLAGRAPARGDVIAFDTQSSLGPFNKTDPSSPKYTSIMRVVGVGGDAIEIRDGKLIRNGEGIEEPYADIERHPWDPNRSFAEVTVQRDTLFVLGDNRGNSRDSRLKGTVPAEFVRGIAKYTATAKARIAIDWRPL